MEYLHSLQVPWSVAHSTIFNQSILDEHDISIEFDVVYLEGVKATGSPNLRNGRLTRRFELVAGFRSYPVFQDDEVIDRGKYDWSNLPVVLGKGEQADSYFERYYTEWDRQKLCPDPRFYLVGSSSWIAAEHERGNGFLCGETKHFLLLGSDFSVEILARDTDIFELDKVSG